MRSSSVISISHLLQLKTTSKERLTFYNPGSVHVFVLNVLNRFKYVSVPCLTLSLSFIIYYISDEIVTILFLNFCFQKETSINGYAPKQMCKY